MKRLACIAVQTRESFESSASQTVLTTLLDEGMSLAFDQKLFSTDAGTPEAPPGLVNGVAPLPSKGSMLRDIDQLGAAVSTFTSGRIVYVAHPTLAAFINNRKGWAIAADVEVWPSLGVAPGTIIALDPGALASAYGPEPEIRSSKEVLLHMDDVPSNIALPGVPTVVAAEARDMFQTDCTATMLIIRAAWVWRASGCIAWTSDATDWGVPTP